MGGLQAGFGPIIAKSLKGLMLVETGSPHYMLDLGEHGMLGIWFDGASKDRPIYWLDLTRPELHESSLRCRKDRYRNQTTPSGADTRAH